MIDFGQFEVLTFDCYGTLVDWETGILKTIKPILEQHRIEVHDERILELYATFESQFQKGEYQTYRTVLAKVMDAFAKQFEFPLQDDQRFAISESIKNWLPFPDTVAALRELQQRYKLGIISNIDDELFAQTAKHLAVDFDWIVTAEQVRSYKPSERNFLFALDRMGMNKERVLHVAASLYHDIAPAKNLGIHAVWVDRRVDQEGGGAAPTATAIPDVKVTDLAGLVEMMSHS